MKKLWRAALLFAMISTLGATVVHAAAWKKYLTPVDQNGNTYKNGETIALPEGEKLFLVFDTDFEHNEDHGISAITGFSDGYPEGTLTTAGFATRTGTAKELKYKGGRFGIEIGCGKLKIGDKGVLNYFLYKYPYVPRDDGEIDFIKTPHVLDQKVYVQVVPKAMKVKSLKAGKKSLTVKWKKQSGITGYQIEYSTKKDFSSGVKKKTVKSAKKTSLKLTKLKAKKKYYVRIRSYKTVKGKKVCSAWSTAKSAKTK